MNTTGTRPFLTLALLAGAIAAGGCASRSGAVPSGDPAPKATAGAVELREETPRRHALQRPGLPADWNWNGQALPTGELDSSLITIEHFAPAQANANAEYQSTIRVKNVSSSVHLADVVVTDHLPADGFKATNANPPGESVGDTMVWKLGHLAPGETRSIVLHGSGAAEGVARGCASVAYTPQVCVETAIVSAGIELKKFAPADVLQCEDIPLRFVVRNPGSGAATGVRIVDQLPAGWTVAGKDTLSFDVGTLKGGESREFTAVARSAKTGSFVNRATATAAGDLKSDASAPTVVRMPFLEITKAAGSATEILSRESTFVITVRNTGDAPAEDFVITDTITGADRIVAASDGGTVTGTRVTWKLAALAPGATRSVSVTAIRDTAGTLSDSATATAKCAAPVTATAQTVYSGIAAILLEMVDDPDPVIVGATTTYTITVTNQGSAPDSDIVVTCSFEDAVEFVSAGGATQFTRDGNKVTFAALATLPAKQVAKWTVVVRGREESDTRFTTTLNTHETGRPVMKTEATRIYK